MTCDCEERVHSKAATAPVNGLEVRNNNGVFLFFSDCLVLFCFFPLVLRREFALNLKGPRAVLSLSRENKSSKRGLVWEFYVHCSAGRLLGLPALELN